MSRRFCFQAFLDNERYVILEDLSYSSYKELLKVLADNNPDIVNFFINDIITDCYVKSNFDFNVEELSILDKTLILLVLKSYSVSAEIKFNITCSKTDKKFNYALNINEIIIFLLQLQMESEYSITSNNLKINFKMPTLFKEYSYGSAMVDWLHSIEYEDKTVPISENIISSLPVGIVSDFNTFVQEQNKKLTSKPIINYTSPFSKDTSNLYISLLDGSIINTIRLFFESDLLDLYETEYFLIKDHNFSQDLFNVKSPAEIFAYISIIQKYKEKESSSTGSPVGEELYTGDSIENED